MKDREFMFGSVEDALREADEAARAGVFNRTPVNARELLQEAAFDAAAPMGRSKPVRRIARAWMAAAAVFILLGTGWNLIFFREFGEMRERLAIKDNKTKSGAVLACVAGPTGTLPNDCNTYDYDSDGDVDMADVQSYQLAIAVNH